MAGIDDGRLIFRFDPPPKSAEPRGAPGRGDSGGPALLRRGPIVHVAGVSSAGYDGANGPGMYGAVDHFTRVSDYLDRIRATIA